MHESDNCWHWYRLHYPWQLAHCIISIKLSWSEVPWHTWTKFGMRQPYNNLQMFVNLQMVTTGFLYSDRATPTTTVVENRRGRDLYTSVQPPKTGAANLIILVQTLPKTTMKMTPLSAWLCVCAHTHTHTTALCPGLLGWASTRNIKTILILLKPDRVSGSGISWAICKSAPHSRQITMPAPQHSVFLQARCSSCRPTNSAKALKATSVPVNALKK